MSKCFRFVCFLLVINIFFTKLTLAESIFQESFDVVNDTNWLYYCNYSYTNPKNRAACDVGTSKVVYGNGAINLSSNDPNFPVIISKNNIIPEDGNFGIEIKFKYPSVTNRGIGLGVGFTGTYGKLFSQFGIWNDSSSGENFKFYYNDFNTNSQNYCSNFTVSTDDLLGRITISNITLTDHEWHYLNIYKIDNFYYVFLDKTYGNIIPIFTTEIKNSCIPKIIWFGNYISDSGGAWTTFSLDDITISSASISSLTPTPTLTPALTPTLMLTPTETPTPTEIPTPTNTPTSTPIPTLTPTPTPTPTPTELVRKKKIFVLPGLGASWNSRAIVYGDNVGDGEWKMTPFVNNYDGVMELLDKNGLVKDRDYFVWNYDWRRPIEEIKNKFNSFVNSKNLTSNDDIYLVGHSLGGVVARLWAQENNDNGNIKQVINLGSPNLGALDVYSVWNGGEVLQYNGISSVAFQILLGLQNRSFVVTDISKIRSFAPVVKDLLPTFDYVLKNNNLVSWNNLNTYNNYLSDKNNSVTNVSNKLTSAVGIGLSTPEVLKLGSRSLYDELLGLWPDGELLNFTNSNGDGTVLQNSASFGANNISELITDHGAIVNDSISIIANKLGLENKAINFSYSDNFKDSVVVFVGSPATAELKCGSDVFTENDGFIVVKNQTVNECNLTLSPTENGLVHLVLGNTKENKWNYMEKEVGVGITDVLVVNFSDNRIIDDVNKDSQYFLKDQIRFDLNYLGLVNSVSDFDQNLLTKVALRVFEYRKENSERIISQRILDDLFELSNLIAWDKGQNSFGSLSDYINSVETSVKNKKNTSEISHNATVSLTLLDDLRNKVIERSGKGLETSYSMVVVLASGYGTEALRD